MSNWIVCVNHHFLVAPISQDSTPKRDAQSTYPTVPGGMWKLPESNPTIDP